MLGDPREDGARRGARRVFQQCLACGEAGAAQVAAGKCFPGGLNQPAMLPPGSPANVGASAQALMAGVPEATYRSAVAALVAFDRRAQLPLISVPTLVITGELDTTAAPEVARKMAERIPGALLLTVPGAGHLLPMEQPAAFNTALLAFLARR